MMKNSEKSMDKIIALCKNRGFVFAGSEIYGGLANSWDYGPLGVEFKNNVKKAWIKKFVQESPYNVGLDAAIIMNPQTWPVITTSFRIQWRSTARIIPAAVRSVRKRLRAVVRAASTSMPTTKATWWRTTASRTDLTAC